MSWNNSRCINSNYPLMMNSQWNDAPFNEDDSYLDEERPHPDPPQRGREQDPHNQELQKY